MADKTLETIEIFIKGRLPDANKLEGQARNNPYSAGRYRDKWKAYISRFLRAVRKKDFDSIFLDILYIEPDRRRDKDNIAGGAKKLILDALVDVEAIYNDGWSFVAGWKEDFVVSKENPGVYIKLTPFELAKKPKRGKKKNVQNRNRRRNKKSLSPSRK